ncbi:hypothetical protein VPBG_00131 [Vibrio phage helene 12B3]|uniref:hypothetical protein n=1 Tax=Vibrio phage helene 12B3 TaxID=573173 RepID=UPI0002C11F79|nr:hypothetical protein VPBG_00131 [Vibrio phage helene 12B3]YP_009223001.1 hypothetical protein VPLG_00152 [Vibrio phage eugene 12A10]AGG57903.1 hypothetical protein VPBG_00131 [Vibrio phage helene 12B3]AGN51591.1 hypothetical protein VPLG_00152 [Vibrio phage eugene 12A10]
MPSAKHVMKFKVQVTDTVSFDLQVDINDLHSKDVETLAKNEAIFMQRMGWFEGINFDSEEFTWYGKIMFSWQGWIN